MGRPKKAVAGEVATKERLLRSAEQEFGQRGYDGARLEDIAEAAGISRPSLLYHYKSKHALYVAVILNVFSEIGQELSGAMRSAGPFRAQLEGVLSRFHQFVSGRPSAAKLILREVLDEKGPGHQLLIDAGRPLLERVEEFIADNGASQIREGLAVRAALMQVVSSEFVKAASGRIRNELWGPTDHTLALARTLLYSQPIQPKKPNWESP